MFHGKEVDIHNSPREIARYWIERLNTGTVQATEVTRLIIWFVLGDINRERYEFNDPLRLEEEYQILSLYYHEVDRMLSQRK